MELKISYGNSRFAKKWSNKTITFDALCERLKTTQRTTETTSEYQRMPKADRDGIKDVGGFVLGHLKGGRRRKTTVESRSGLTLDVDHADQGFVNNAALKCDYQCIIYSTHSHTTEQPRLRLILPAIRDMAPEEYAAISRFVASGLGMDYFDDSTYEPERLMYWPSSPLDGEYIFKVIEGRLLDPDEILLEYPNWRDCSLWPTSSRQSEVVQRDVKRQEDPLTKDGIVGAFCRTYSIEDVIDTYLSDVYEPSAVDGRYDYIPADSAAGVILYDGKYAYSHHATDPANGNLLNAFDLVRIHKFGDLDEKFSFRAMADLALEDENVRLTLADERREEAKQEFTGDDTNWTKRLEYERSGKMQNTLRNVTLLLENDPNLKCIVFNELADCIEVKGTAPWKRPKNQKYWRNADDAQLVRYMDAQYGVTFSAYNFNIALTAVSDDRSYHPIVEFIEALPLWDGMQRVDTIMIDYFSAADNEYVRAVTRKMFCGAIARAMNPGCKFDYMLVMNGPQGLGKSTLMNKLGGEWFNDSLSLADTHDKTAAEKLQGYWIFEIPELNGLGRADVNTLRGFLSSQNDVYRPSYGRRVLQHPRQCVFFGSANESRGYLRDTTGNRRFWPVKTPCVGKKDSTKTTHEEVLQIWAEAKEYYEAGEQVFLPDELEAFARIEQREAMEEDEREGVVRDFLDMLLPEDWDIMDTYERREYFEDALTGKPPKPGKYQRTEVCGLEVWCECFGREKSQYRARERHEMAAIFARLGGWSTRQGYKPRVPLYGQQSVYVIDDAEAFTKLSHPKVNRPRFSVIDGSNVKAK